MLILHYSLNILGIIDTIRLIHSLGSSSLSFLVSSQNISNNHLGTEGAEAIASLLLDNASYLYALQLSGGLHAPSDSSGSEILCVSFQSLIPRMLVRLSVMALTVT